MLHRSLPDPPPPADADSDTAAMAAGEADVERGERHLRVLARLTDIAMNLAEALGRQAVARIEATIEGGAAPAPGEDPAAAFTVSGDTILISALFHGHATSGNGRGLVLLPRRRSRILRPAGRRSAAVDHNSIPLAARP